MHVPFLIFIFIHLRLPLYHFYNPYLNFYKPVFFIYLKIKQKLISLFSFLAKLTTSNMAQPNPKANTTRRRVGENRERRVIGFFLFSFYFF
jgi:hypothetical protein